MIGIISDVHGNYPALEAVLNALARENCDIIYCLGDVCGYYCMINECIDALRLTNICTIKGNHESYLVEGKNCPRSKSASQCIQYQRQIIVEENYQWLYSLPKEIKTDTMWAVHGGWSNYLDEYIFDFDFEQKAVCDSNANFFLSGHTHKASIQRNDGKIYCNPGSVGQPRDYNSKAAYAVIKNNQIFLRRVEYDIDWIAMEMKKAGFTEHFYENLYRGCKIGEKL